MGSQSTIVALDPRAEMDRIEREWTERLAPYTGRVLWLRCVCNAVFDKLQPLGWSLAPAPTGPHPGDQKRPTWPEVEKSVTAGPPPGYLLKITYIHRSRQCPAKGRPFTFTGDRLAEEFIRLASTRPGRIDIKLRA